MKVLKGLEQRRDIEKALVKNEARSASDPRKAGKISSYMTNVSLGLHPPRCISFHILKMKYPRFLAELQLLLKDF